VRFDAGSDRLAAGTPNDEPRHPYVASRRSPPGARGPIKSVAEKADRPAGKVMLATFVDEQLERLHLVERTAPRAIASLVHRDDGEVQQIR
jgi:hypothetical protein